MGALAEQRDPRHAEVEAALDRVCDPELDEPVTELGFIEAVDIDDAGDVTVGFRLPTFWCSPNFAWLMASGIATEVGRLPWAGAVRPVLRDHMFGEQINEGVASGQSFTETFGDEAESDIEAVREKFRIKAFQRRQEAVLRGLLADGETAETIAAMTAGELEGRTLGNLDAERQRLRYLDIRPGFAKDNAQAFTDENGAPVTADGFSARLELLRSVRLNMEFTGSICRSLLSVRDEAAKPAGAT